MASYGLDKSAIKHCNSITLDKWDKYITPKYITSYLGHFLYQHTD